MTQLPPELLGTVLAAAARPDGQPLYPQVFAAQSGLDRGLLDQALDQLRLAGMIRLTDWSPGRGQGYVVTEEGKEVLRQGGAVQSLTPRPRAQPRLTRMNDSAWERGEAIRDALLHPSPPVATLTILMLNLLVFVGGLGLALNQGVPLNLYLSGNLLRGQVAEGKADRAQQAYFQLQGQLGALRPTDVLGRDQWWRLITYGFVHGGFLHILFNMIALYSLGPAVERMWGRSRFVALYLISLVTGGCASLMAMQAVVGASGALSGVMVSLVAWVLLNRQSLPGEWVKRVFSGMLGNLVLLVFLSFMPGVSWQCHLGGALGGLLLSVPLNLSRFYTGWRRWLGVVGIALAPLAAFGLVWATVWDPMLRMQVDFAEAEIRLFQTYKEELQPIFKWNQTFKDSKEFDRQFPTARAAFREAIDELEPSRRRFAEPSRFAKEEQNTSVEKTRAYLDTWGELYAQAQSYGDRPDKANLGGLQEHHAHLLKLIPAQQNNSFFPSLRSEKK